MYRADDWHKSSGEIYQFCKEILGSNLLHNITDFYLSHPTWLIGCPFDFDFTTLEKQLKQYLDLIDWQLLDKSKRQFEGHNLLYHILAPMIQENISIAYHTTATDKLPMIMQEGLLPSNHERCMTQYPETFGRLHVSKSLKTIPGGGDGAVFWTKELKKSHDGPFGIIEVDLSDLPAKARVYRDVRSHWGVVIDRFESIPPDKLRIVPIEEWS